MFDVKVKKMKSKMIEFKRKTVWNLDELFNIASLISYIDINDIKNKYYIDFYKLLKDMENNNIIRKYGTEQNSMQPRLYKRYKLIKENDDLNKDEEIKAMALNKLNLTYYKKRATEFKEDYGILVILNEYMRNKDEYKNLGLNEISYELFGYEKDMTKTKEEEGRASKVMGKIGLNEDNIGCRIKFRPLLNTIYKGFYEKEIRNVLVVENQETYWTLNRFLRENRTSVDMLIFGEGYSVTKNFEGIIQYGVTTDDNIIYYGDIDLEGVCIYSLFKKKFNNFNVSPYVKLYTRLLSTGLAKGVNKSISPNQNAPSDDEMKEFLGWFDDKERDEIERILVNRLYIPQESLNYDKLRGVSLE